MRTRTHLAIGSIILALGAIALTASRRPAVFGIECGSLGLPDRQVLIRVPTDPTGLRVEITTSASPRSADGEEKTTLRVRAGTDSLSCYATGPSSFILDLTRLASDTVHLAIEMPHTIALEAKSQGGLPRGSMELAPSAAGSFTW